jgi:hypothetical protein
MFVLLSYLLINPVPAMCPHIGRNISVAFPRYNDEKQYKLLEHMITSQLHKNVKSISASLLRIVGYGNPIFPIGDATITTLWSGYFALALFINSCILFSAIGA